MQVLTLANGDRILMTPQMKAMFEAENLNNASPATVSRAGIIYVSSTELGWAPVVASWLQTRPAAEAEALRPLFDRLVDPMLDFVRHAPFMRFRRALLNPKNQSPKPCGRCLTCWWTPCSTLSGMPLSGISNTHCLNPRF